MKNNITLKNRIVIAFTIQTLLLALLAFSTISLYVDYIEETVLYEHYDSYLDSYVIELDEGDTPSMPVGIKIYNRTQQEVPGYAKNIGLGGHEIVLENGTAYHVLNKQFDNRVFTLIKDQTKFESTEKMINSLTLITLFIFTVVSFLFSRSLANRIIQPVVNLADKMPALTVENLHETQLDYPDDEIGKLVKVIYDHVNTLNSYLQREKWFTGDISHELRTPMMVISSSVELLESASISDDQKTQLYHKIAVAIENVNELINTFLMLARKKDDNNLENASCDLVELTHNVIESVKPLIEEKKIRFKVHPEKPAIHQINSMLFSIVLTNLIKNSIAHIDEGEISVVLEQDSVVIKDTGKGLPAIVKQFINSDDITSTSRNNSHLGLGLSIVKRICERQQWGVIAYDNEEGGASFMIKF